MSVSEGIKKRTNTLRVLVGFFYGDLLPVIKQKILISFNIQSYFELFITSSSTMKSKLFEISPLFEVSYAMSRSTFTLIQYASVPEAV